VAFKQTAEFIANYIPKGKLAAVDGRIQIRTYTDKDGQKRWVTEVICSSVYPLSPRDSNSSESATTSTSSLGHEVNYDPDSIPF